jgi:hypothetical protein
MLVDSTNTNPADTESDEMSDIRFVQKTRKQLVTKLFGKDGSLPDANADKIVLMQALDGLDNSAIKRLRLKSEMANTNANVANAALMASLLMRINAGNTQVTISNREIPMLELEHSGVTLVPGELEIGTRNLTFDEFNANFEGENPG